MSMPENNIVFQLSIRDFDTFAKYGDALSSEYRGTAVHLNKQTTQNNSQVTVNNLKFSDTDSRWNLNRAESDMIENNEIRTAFLKALEKGLGLDVANFPKRIKSALNISDFGLSDKNATSGKPLTSYRIRQVCNAIETAKDNNEIQMARYNEAIRKCDTKLEELKKKASSTNENTQLYNDAKQFLYKHSAWVVEPVKLYIKDMHKIIENRHLLHFTEQKTAAKARIRSLSFTLYNRIFENKSVDKSKERLFDDLEKGVNSTETTKKVAEAIKTYMNETKDMLLNLIENEDYGTGQELRNAIKDANKK